MAEAVGEGIKIKVGLDDGSLKTELNNAVSNTDRAFKDIVKQVETLNKKSIYKLNMKDLDKQIKDVETRYNDLSKTRQTIFNTRVHTEDVKKQLDFIDQRMTALAKDKEINLSIKEAKKNSLKDVENRIEKLKKEKEIKKDIAVNAKTTIEHRKTLKEIEELDKQLKDLEKVREIKVELDGKKADALRTSLKSINKIVTGVVVGVGALTAALGAATKQAIDFGSQFAEVETLLGDMPESGVNQLKQGVIDLSKEFGVLTGEGIPALYQAISAGVAPDNAIEFLETASKTAIGGVTDLTTSVDGLTSVINAYGKDTIDAQKASDIMFTAMKLGKTTIGELSRSFFNVIPVASALGVKFEDVSAAISSITAQGTPTAQATTYLRAALNDLSSEGSKAAKLFKQLSGKTFKDFIASGGNLQQALQMMEQHAKSNNTTINNLFNSVEAGQAALALTGKGAEKFSSDLKAMGEAAGATQEAFDKINEQPAQRLKRIMASVQALTLELGQKLIPTAERLISIVEKNLPSISKFVEVVGRVLVTIAQHGKIAVSIISGLAAGFVTLNVALALTAPSALGAATGIGAITLAFTGLNAATGGLVLAIGGVVTALVLLLTNLDKVKIAFDHVAAAIGNTEAKMNVASRNAKNASDSMKDMAASISQSRIEADKLIATYDKLSKKQNRNEEENKKLKSTLEQIKEMYPALADEIEKNGGKISEGMGTGFFISKDEIKLMNEAKNAYKTTSKALEEAYAHKEKLEKDKASRPVYQSTTSLDKEILEVEEKITKLEEQKTAAQKQQAEIQSGALKRQSGEAASMENQLDIQNEINKAYAMTQGGKGDKNKDKLKELEKEYAAKKIIINNTVKDEIKKTETLDANDKDYYERRIKLQEDKAKELIAGGKNQTRAEKANLDTIYKDIADTQEKLNTLSKDSNYQDRIKDLETVYDAQTKINEATVQDEKKRAAAQKNIDRQLQADKLEILEQAAMKLQESYGSLSDTQKAELQALYKQIEATKIKLDELTDKEKDKDFTEQLKENWQQLVSYVANVVNSISDMFNQMWDNQIDKIENALDKELKIIKDREDAEIKAVENKLKRETELYKNQIKELEDRENERKKIITETEEEIAGINEEIGEHTTEEKYNELIAQREALEEKLLAEQEALAADQEAKKIMEEEQRTRENEAALAKEKAETEARKRKEEAEKKAAIEKAKIERKQAEANKATQLFNAIINMASGIAAAWAMGLPMGPIAAALVGAMTGVQIATIKNTPLPEIPTFAAGGYVPRGNEQFYKNLIGNSGNSKDKTLLWASEGERILNHNETAIWNNMQARELKNTINNNNNNPVVNISGITVNAGNTKDANKIANLSARTIAREVVNVISRGYS